MADEKTGAGGADDNTPDPITNLKGEFNRKLGNVEQQMAALAEGNKALMAQLQTMSKPAASSAPAEDEDAEIEALWFNEPKKAAAKLTEKVTKTVMGAVNQISDSNTRKANTINELVGEYPELRSDSHPLTKRAVEIFNGMAKSDQSNPMAYKAAVNQAASEMSVVPKSKREDDYESDDFALNGSGSSSVRTETRKRGRSSDGISPATEEFARLVGVDMDDAKVKERLKTKHGRKSYTRYE